MSSVTGSSSFSSFASTCTSLCTALSPSSGYAECAILPVARNTTRSAPFEASATRLSVGSPLIRNRLPFGFRFAAFAPAESRSSPDTNSNPIRKPAARSTSAAATCAAIIPFASETPRPCMKFRVFAEWNVRRHGVHVRRKNQIGRFACRSPIHVPARPRRCALHRLRHGSLLHFPPALGKKTRKKIAYRALVVGRRFDLA